jgi:DNA mismatch repair protein MutS2
MKNMHALLFNQKEKQVTEKKQKKLDTRFVALTDEPTIGAMVLMKQNNKVGVLAAIRGKKAIVNLGAMPLQVNLEDLVVVREKVQEQQ